MWYVLGKEMTKRSLIMKNMQNIQITQNMQNTKPAEYAKYGNSLLWSLNSPPGENVNYFTTWWKIFSINSVSFFHHIVKMLNPTPPREKNF